MIKIFFDTEFTGLHKNTTLMSIGVAYETGEYFYAELTDYDKSQVDGWIEQNVVRNFSLGHMVENTAEIDMDGSMMLVKGRKEFVAKEFDKWNRQICKGEKIEVWSDCLAYDWMLFNDLYGHAFDIPDNIYYIPFDICTLFKLKGIDPDISREEYSGVEGDKHHALHDASVIKICYEKLMLETA